MCAGEQMQMSGITSLIWPLSPLTTHLNRCMPVAGLTLAGLDWEMREKWWMYVRKRSKCGRQKINCSWATEWPARPFFGQSLCKFRLIITESYCLYVCAVEGGTAQRVCSNNSMLLLWNDLCWTCTLCQIWSLSMWGCGTCKHISSLARKVVIALWRLGRLYRVVASSILSCSDGLVAKWKPVVKVANIQ